MEIKKISVCIATYNGSLFIEKQLYSILKQLNPNDEIIISDDCSTDNTIHLVNQFDDKRINVFQNRGRRGPLGNFENALMRVSGDVIFLADQDDEWMPYKVKNTLSLLVNFDLVLSDCRVINGEGKVLHDSFFSYRGSRVGFWRNMYKNSYIGCCMAFRREVLSYVLPFPNHIHMHDWWIGLLVEVKGNVFFYPKPLINYTRHGGNASPTGEMGYPLKRKFLNRLKMLFSLSKRLLM